MLLISISFSTTSSQELVCYIREQLIKATDGDLNTPKIDYFWGHLPDGKCTRFIFIVENFRRPRLEWYMALFQYRKPKAELGVMVSRNTKDDICTYAFDWVNRYFNGIHFIWDYRYGNPYNANERREFIDTARSNFTSSKTVSQAIECNHKSKEPFDLSNTVNDVDLTVVLVKLFEDEVPSFLIDPKKCVVKLEDLHIPYKKAVIGLQELTGDRDEDLANFRERCHDDDVHEMLEDISYELSCIAIDKGLQGVMVWSIANDDYTGDVCKMGEYPNIEQTLEALDIASGAIVIKPLNCAQEMYVVVWALLSHVLYDR